jgi:hypothetical protein
MAMKWMNTQVAASLLTVNCAYAKEERNVQKTVFAGKAWAGHLVGFTFETRGEDQYVGWYDENRVMTFAQRKLGSDKWKVQRLESSVGWDSHNYIALAFDRDGCLHVSGNLHVSPLTCWRSEKPGDIATLKPVHRMIGKDEEQCTYPQFPSGVGGQLIFLYRDGSSGAGRWLVNAYDEKKKSWTRILSAPLFADRLGNRSVCAYPVGMGTGPDGVFHVFWVWRNSPDCSSNHDLCYVRTRDFKAWTNSRGEPVSLPLALNAEVVDPIPTNAGLLNFGGFSFDQAGRPVVTYIKFDEKGNTQVYAARPGKEGWKIHQLTRWDYRWRFEGGGSIQSEISWSALTSDAETKALQMNFKHVKRGPGQLVQTFDPETLKPLGEARPYRPWPEELTRVRSDFPGMETHLMDSPPIEHDGRIVRWILRWETLPPNRDAPRDKYPPTGALEVIELARESAAGSSDRVIRVGYEIPVKQ